MKTLFFLPDLNGGGAQRTFVNLVNELAGSDTAPVLAVANANGPGRKWLAPEVRLVDFQARRTRGALFPLRRLIRTERPDVLVSTMIDANIVAGLAALSSGARRPRLIVRETNSHRASGAISAPRRLAAGWVYRRADRVVALSRGVADELRADYRLRCARVATIHNPVDIEAIARSAKTARALSAAERRDRPALVVAAGRLTHQKGFDLLIEAFAAIETGAELAILGDGPDRRALEKQAAERGISDRVRLAGFVDNPAEWFARADLFVLSSRWEGFGHVMVEAMAAGTPVVAFDCPYGPADIIRDGETGRLVPNGDTAALGAAIAELLADEAARTALVSRASDEIVRFASPAIAGAYRHLIREVHGPERNRRMRAA